MADEYREEARTDGARASPPSAIPVSSSLLTPVRRRVVRSRSLGREQFLSKSQGLDTTNTDRQKQQQQQEKLIQELQAYKKQANVDIHQLKQQWSDAKQRASQLERKCDQQTRELSRVKAENEKQQVSIKSLNEQCRQLKQEGRARSQDRFSSRQSTITTANSSNSSSRSSSISQFDYRSSSSVRRQTPVVNPHNRGRVRKKTDKDVTADDDMMVPKKTLNDLMMKCSEEFGLIKSQLKSQEEVFQGLQRGFSLDRLYIPEHQQASQQQDSQRSGLPRPLVRSYSYSQEHPDNVDASSKPNGIESILRSQEPTSVSQSNLSSSNTTEDSLGREQTSSSRRGKNRVRLSIPGENAELQELKAQLTEQQNLIHEQWKLLKNKEEAIGQEKTKLENEWKFRTDELEIQLKDADERLTKERDSHNEMLTKVQEEAEKNKDETKRRIDEMMQQIQDLSTTTRSNGYDSPAASLETENSNLKELLQEVQLQQMRSQANLQVAQYMNSSINSPPMNYSLTSSINSPPINQYMNSSINSPVNQHINHQQSMDQFHHPSYQHPPPGLLQINSPSSSYQASRSMSPLTVVVSPTPQLTTAGASARGWVVPHALYQDERLGKMLDQLMNKMDNRVGMSVLRSHDISRQHSGRVLMPVIGSAGVANNIHAAFEKTNIGDIAVIILVFHPLAPHNCNLYTTTKNRVRESEPWFHRCIAIIDMAVWHGVFYDCEANDNGVKELREIAGRFSQYL